MFLDAHTLLVTAVLTALLMAGAHFVLWTYDRQQAAPLWMAGATLLCSLSAVLRELLPEREAIVSANVLLALGLGAIATACRVFSKRPVAWFALSLPALAWLSACSFPAFMADQQVRSVASSLSCALVMAWAVLELWHARPQSAKARTGLMLILSAQGVAALARAVVIGLSVAHQQGVARTADVSRATFWSFGFLLLIGFGIIFLIKEQSEQRLRTYIDEDALTGLANRRRFDIELDAALERAVQAQRPVSVLMIDADAFKAYNDLYGHVAGDRTLRTIAHVLGATVSKTGGVAARYGGEEFALLLPDADATEASRVGQAACSGVRDMGLEHSGSAHGTVTISIGFASLIPTRGERARDILIAADKALYDAKHAGRDRVRRAPWPPQSAPFSLADLSVTSPKADPAQGS